MRYTHVTEPQCTSTHKLLPLYADKVCAPNYSSDAGNEQLMSGQQIILMLKHTLQE